MSSQESDVDKRIAQIFALSPHVRYVAVYEDRKLNSAQRNSIELASSGESDRYEELLVNPTLLKLVSQRGDIDCGGAGFLIVRYGHFYQVVIPTERGHVSVCLETVADVIRCAEDIVSVSGGH